jgi:hypothetical protein
MFRTSHTIDDILCAFRECYLFRIILTHLRPEKKGNQDAVLLNCQT